VSVGVVADQPRVDLEYEEDSTAAVDMNVVMTGAGGFVELQGTAEGAPFARAQLDALLSLAETGIAHLIAEQEQALGLLAA
jgi:ribonuclease PH